MIILCRWQAASGAHFAGNFPEGRRRRSVSRLVRSSNQLLRERTSSEGILPRFQPRRNVLSRDQCLIKSQVHHFSTFNSNITPIIQVPFSLYMLSYSVASGLCSAASTACSSSDLRKSSVRVWSVCVPKQKLRLEPCFQLGDLPRGLLVGPVELRDVTPFVPQPVETSNVCQ